MIRLALVVLLLAPAHAAPPVFDHLLDGKHFQSSATGAAQLPDGDVLVAGYMVSKPSKQDDRPRLVRVAPTGEVRWERDYPQFNYTYPTAVRATPDGSVVMLVRQLKRKKRPLWVHIDGQGKVLSSTEIGDPRCMPVNFAFTHDGAVVVGYCMTPDGKSRPWMEGIDAKGARRWVHAFPDAPASVDGIVALPGGREVVVVGWAYTGKARHNEALVMRLKSDGTKVRQKLHGGKGIDVLQDVIIDRKQLIAAGARGAKEKMRPWVVAFDLTGRKVRWQWQPKGTETGFVGTLSTGPHGLIASGVFTHSAYATYGQAFLAQIAKRGKAGWLRGYGTGQTEVIDGLVQTKAGLIGAGRHSSRKSYLNGLWIFGVAPDGTPDGKRETRGGTR